MGVSVGWKCLRFSLAPHTTKMLRRKAPGKENFESTKTAKMIEHFMFPNLRIYCFEIFEI